jgi:serine/threonine protein kinase
MLVMDEMDVNLRNYIQQNHEKLTWKERIQIINDVVIALSKIHKENAIHRDLHSGNILYSQLDQRFYISDLGFCGPADKPLSSVYGNLPYIAPEVIVEKETTFASDIYSIGIIMWEISSGQPPFIDDKNDYDLVIKIINGTRPEIIPETPLEYKELMEQCWDADSTKRPNANDLSNKINKINRSYYQSEKQQANSNNGNVIIKSNPSTVNSLARNFSKLHIFKGLPEPKNATKCNNYYDIYNKHN